MKALLFTALAILALDQASKEAIVAGLSLAEVGVIDIAPPYLRFVMAWNTGVNFGLGGGWVGPWLLIALALAISLGVGIWALRRTSLALHIGAGLMIGGAIGNSIDRARFGAVADFLNMSCCGINNPYAFNVADIAIFAGVGCLLIFGDGKKTDSAG